jgi:hypothetical protein
MRPSTRFGFRGVSIIAADFNQRGRTIQHVEAKLARWKAAYDELSAAQAAVVDALKRNASDEEIEQLKADVKRLHAESEAALEDFQRQIVIYKSSQSSKQ